MALTDFVLGKLPLEACDQVASHVEVCPDCQDTVQMLDHHSDTLVAMLGKPAAPPSTEDACRQAVEVAAASAPGKQAASSQASSSPSVSTPVLSRETFLVHLREAGIVAEEVWPQIESDRACAEASDGAALARLLIERRILTPFQAQAIARGKTRGLAFGEYLVLDRLGAGGMGQVFRARHQRMERTVALKVMTSSAMKNPESIRRFQREVKAAARLIHPNIVTAFDAGEESDMLYLVMEYVEGQDLSAYVRANGPMSWQEAVQCIAQAARGLAFAHARGVVHRDIKPANLLRDSHGMIKILDMGLARLEEPAGRTSDDGLTHAGTVMGTVDYMAPEQAFNTRNAAAPADVYSLGCTLFRLLSNQPMYDGETVVEKILAHREKPVPSLQQVCPDAPDELVALFEAMVDKNPAARPTMDEVAARLESIDLSPPRTAAVPPWRRRTVQIATAAAGSLAILFGVIVILRGSNNEELGRVEVDGNGPVQVSTAPGVQAEIRNTPPPASATASVAQPSPPRPTPVPSAMVPPKTPPLATAKPGQPATSALPPLAIAPFNAAQARALQEAWAKYLKTKVETNNSIGATMVLIPPGEFRFGSTDEQIEEALKYPDLPSQLHSRISALERPQRTVVVTRPFLISATEITVGQFKKFSATGYLTAPERDLAARRTKHLEPGKPLTPISTYLQPASGIVVTDEMPVAFISGDDAVAFCRWLSEEENATYRLPTTAEWEYACRAGTTTQFSFGDNPALLDQYDWYRGNIVGGTRPAVGTKLPNPFGLFGMHGGLAEWCGTPLAPDGRRSVRGGSWHTPAVFCRSASRNHLSSNLAYGDCGFRILRELDLPKSPAQ